MIPRHEGLLYVFNNDLRQRHRLMGRLRVSLIIAWLTDDITFLEEATQCLLELCHMHGNSGGVMVSNVKTAQKGHAYFAKITCQTCNETVDACHGRERRLATLSQVGAQSMIPCFEDKDECNRAQQANVPASRDGEALKARLDKVEVY